jgi:corrinoid protein of di/trimethylamine methyltransferase
MPTENEIQEALNKLKEAVLAPDIDAARQAAEEIVANGIDPMRAIEEGIRGTTDLLAGRFDTGEIYLPHLVLTGEAMTEASKVLEPALPGDPLAARKTVVIGTVEGDLHSVGKNIVTMMLRTSGFEVHDLGVDVRSSAFVQRARDLNADVIALSCLMTTTLPYQREVIEELESLGLREDFSVMIGGGPVTQEWADEIGADGFGKDAGEAVAEARRLVATDG